MLTAALALFALAQGPTTIHPEIWEGLPEERLPARITVEEEVHFLAPGARGFDPVAAAESVFPGAQFAVEREQAPSLSSPRRVLLERTLSGHPVTGEVVRVNQLADGRTLVVGAVAPLPTLSGFDSIGAARAEAIALAQYDAKWVPETHGKRLEALPLANGAHLSWRVDVTTPATDSVAHRIWIDAESGEVLATRSVALHQVTGKGLVFDPNPVQTLDDGGLRDQNNSPTAVPQAGYTQVDLLDLNGSGYLTGPWASTESTSGRANRPSHDFRQWRNQFVFEESNGYYHVDTYQRYLQSLGLNARRAKQKIDVRDLLFGIIEYPNASYNSATKVIAFGTLGVDFAEDADVILHEYGHAIHDDVQGGIGSGENGAMSEGYGDWFSCSWYDDALLGEWVGTSFGNQGGSFPWVRRADGMKVYPGDLVNQVHADGELWCAALFEIAQMVGYDVATTLVIEGMALQTRNTGMRSAAQFLRTADQQVYGGAHDAYLLGALWRSGLVDVPATEAALHATRRFLRTGASVTIQLESPSDPGANYVIVLSDQATATPTGPPYNTTLAIGTNYLQLSSTLPGLMGTLDGSGNASLSLNVPPLPYKQKVFAQAMILDAAGNSAKESAPIAFRAERH